MDYCNSTKKYDTTEYARKNRKKHLEKYRDYQKNYHRTKYNQDPNFKKIKLFNAKMKYYYETDPLPSIRKLWT